MKIHKLTVQRESRFRGVEAASRRKDWALSTGSEWPRRRRPVPKRLNDTLVGCEEKDMPETGWMTGWSFSILAWTMIS